MHLYPGNNLSNIAINSEINAKDINSYIVNKISKKPKLQKPTKTLKEEIICEILNAANGMFLYVNFIIDEISGKGREQQIRQSLQTFPKGLEETYKRTLERYSENTDPNAVRDLNKLLGFVLVAVHPLNLGS